MLPYVTIRVLKVVRIFCPIAVSTGYEIVFVELVLIVEFEFLTLNYENVFTNFTVY